MATRKFSIRLQLSILFVLNVLCLNIQAQNTVGLLSYQPFKSYDGYNLIYPHNQPNVFLIDNCGELVHTWEGEVDTRPGNVAYLLEDGRLVKTLRSASITGDAIWAGGGGATIEIRDWDNQLEWSFTMNDSLQRLHHDITVIPQQDGGIHIMAIAWEKKNVDELIAAGRDTSILAIGELWPDYIFEIDPETDEIVWEWHAWDHLVQDFDATKSNFGDVTSENRRVDINFDFTGTGAADWMHGNAIDYDPINDQVILCVPNFSEVWIIDHTTTTAEAATGNGGFGGRGGDLMYRAGNPAAYKNFDIPQTLFYPHDAHFINDFIEGFDPNFGSLAVFNNRIGTDFSTANVWRSGFDMYDWAFPADATGAWTTEFTKTITHPIDSTLMYSTGLSSIQYLPNSNYLICVGRFGYSFELTPDNEIVWEYKTPILGGSFVEQGDILTINNNLTFRMDRYPVDYAAFEERDLSAKGWLELNPNTTFCDIILPITSVDPIYDLSVFPNPATDMITILWDQQQWINIAIYDAMGREVVQPMRINGGRRYIDISNLHSGLYHIVADGKESISFVKE